MGEHTPGPWSAHPRLSGSENHKGWRIFGKSGHVIGEVYPLTSEGSPAAEANARLIADAPSMAAHIAELSSDLQRYREASATDEQRIRELELGRELAEARAALRVASDDRIRLADRVAAAEVRAGAALWDVELWKGLTVSEQARADAAEREINRLADYLLEHHQSAITEGSAVDVALRLLAIYRDVLRERIAKWEHHKSTRGWSAAFWIAETINAMDALLSREVAAVPAEQPQFCRDCGVQLGVGDHEVCLATPSEAATEGTQEEAPKCAMCYPVDGDELRYVWDAEAGHWTAEHPERVCEHHYSLEA